jgi:predicted RNA-binding Zn ribbon-like protein
MAQAAKPAPGKLEHVRAFVNTFEHERGTEQLSSARSLVDWLAARGLASPGIRASRNDLQQAAQLREALRATLLANTHGEPTPAEACALIDQAAERARLVPRLREDRTTALEPQSGGIDGALGRLLAIVHESVADGTWQRLKACREKTCGWAFYDHTKNRSGTWCTMDVCGNRAKARAYRERRRPDASA